jgi:hypothetical protein
MVGAPIAAAPKQLTDQLAALGDRGVLVFVIHDATWHEGVTALARQFGESGSAIEAVHSPTELLRVLADTIEFPLAAGELRGRDESRPIVISALESPVDGPLGWVTASQPLDGPPIGLRHQVVLPATDPAALSESLANWIEGEVADASGDESKDRRQAWPELVEGRAGARAWRSRTGVVAVLPEAAQLRVVFVHASRLPNGELDRWRAQLDNQPVEPPDTPALRLLGEPASSVTVLVRPWRIRGASASAGAYHGRRALDDVPFDQRLMATARATHIALGGELMMPDDGAELDDWAVSLSVKDDVLRVRAIGSLTELGRKVLDAGSVATVTPLRVAATDVLVDSWITADPLAWLASSEVQPSLVAIPPSEALELWRNCGIGCPSHAALRRPFASSSQWLGGGSVPASKLLSDEPHLVGVQFVQLRPNRDGPRRALALLSDAPGGDVDALAKFFGQLLGADLRSAVARRGDTSVMLLGQGVDPAEVFDLDAPVQGSTAIAEVELARGISAGELLGIDRLRGLDGPISARLHVLESAVALELVLGEREQLSVAPHFDIAAWPSPMRPAVASPGDACLVDAVRQTLPGLEVLWTAAPAQRLLGVTGALSKATPAFACARQHPPTAEAGAELQRMLIELAAATHVEQLEFDAALALLERGCAETSNARVCARKDALRDGPKPKLPRSADAVALACTNENSYAEPGRLESTPLAVSREGVRIGDVTVPATREAIAQAIVAQLHPDALAERRLSALSVNLIVDQGLELAALTPVFEGLGALGYEDVGVAYVPIDGGLAYSRSIHLRAPASFDVTLPELPPNADEPPQPKPKSGLYEMKGPKSAVPTMERGEPAERIDVRLAGGRAKVDRDGKVETLALTDLGVLAVDGDRWTTGIELRASKSTRWADVATAVAELCPLQVTLVVAP